MAYSVGPRIGPALGIDPLEGYDKDSFEIIEQRRKDIADIRALQEKEEEK